MAAYGGHPQTQEETDPILNDIFINHPACYFNDAKEAVLPADNLPDIFRAYSERRDGLDLLNDGEFAMLKNLITSEPDIKVPLSLLQGFIAARTQASPPHTPDIENGSGGSGGSGDDEERGRSDYWDDSYEGHHRRSSSNESTGTDIFYRSGSRPSSRGPPSTPLNKSRFDSERRQRSTPLTNVAPSSWSRRPAPASRRKSDAGSRSDSESGPSSFRNSTGSRSRAPSNPTSPATSHSGLTLSDAAFSPVSSPSRSHSRTRSQPQTGFSSFGFEDHGYTSPEESHTLSSADFNKSINSLPMPRQHDEYSDSEDEDSLGLVMDRESVSSAASMQPLDRLDALTRAHAELSKKLHEAEATLANRLSEHEIVIEEMEGRLEEKNSELSAAKREEKELRSKERQHTSTIAMLEMEVSKLSKQVEHGRATYASLQKQYQEQCALSEKYRDDLRQRDETIRNLRESLSLHEVESGKWAREQQTYEDRLLQLENELAIAQQAHEQLSEQKQENLLLKETIDRMRFDMDEMRNNKDGGGASGSGHASARNTMSKSLGAELLGKMDWMDGEDDEGSEEEGETLDGESESTAVEEEESDGEDVIQTIITRKKRKVASRALSSKIERREFEEIKEYSDSWTQYEAELFFFSHASQTEAEPVVVKHAFAAQTPAEPPMEGGVQTDPEPMPVPRVTIEMEIQTDVAEEEGEGGEEAKDRTRSPSPHDESLASSSSTIIPPTPKASNRQLEELTGNLDQPPAYNQINVQEREERDWQVASETLKKWHGDPEIPFKGVPGGVTLETIEEWKALKEELGVECTVIDKIIEASKRAPSARKEDKVPRRGKLYNIYNTYIFGDKNNSLSLSSLASQAIAVVGVSAVVILAVTPYMAPQYNIPGGPTAYDRSAWSSFNTMQAGGEGFGHDGTAAVLGFLGRIGIGAARMARGWPT